MAAPIRPAATKAFGAEKWVFVPTIADPTAPKLSTELKGDGESAEAAIKQSRSRSPARRRSRSRSWPDPDPEAAGSTAAALAQLSTVEEAC
jgi:hypothetical protein